MSIIDVVSEEVMERIRRHKQIRRESYENHTRIRRELTRKCKRQNVGLNTIDERPPTPNGQLNN